ncbi:MAG: NAD(P)H-dependent oxidoreductase subunit E, partial [Longimicrobiales bacterium]
MPKNKRKGGAAVALRPAPKGREVDGRALDEVRALLGDRARHADLLIEHLHLIQDAYGHLSSARLTALAFELRLTPAEVYEVASFYHHFDIVKEKEAPPPPVTVRVCESIACALAGCDQLIEDVRAHAGAGVRVLAAPCVGRCEAAPVAVVGTNAIGRASQDVVVDAVRDGRTTHVPQPFVAYDDYRANGGYAVLAACAEGRRSVDDVIATVDGAGLRGLGGAGFPTSRKWTFVRAEPKPRVVALNADEGEPGTFKDRVCIESDPHRVLEGLLVAAWVVEAEDVYIYLRDEYAGCRAILTRELDALRADPPCA